MSEFSFLLLECPQTTGIGSPTTHGKDVSLDGFDCKNQGLRPDKFQHAGSRPIESAVAMANLPANPTGWKASDMRG